jgi:glycosyltransferase involved in cell wall biosynthesis
MRQPAPPCGVAGPERPLVIVAGAIAPYTNRLYDAFARATGIPLHVLVCVDVEPQRKWLMPAANHYTLEVLNGWRFHRSDLRNVYLNPGILSRLAQLRPRAILLGGFSPTMMLAAAYARASGISLGVMTDGSVEMDPGRHSRLHRLMRRAVVPRASVGIGASEDSVRLLVQYGLAPQRGFVVPIACPWPMPEGVPSFDARPYDILFCGTLEDERKGAGFFGDVVLAAQARGVDLRVRVAGDGPLREALERRFQDTGITARFDGYVQPEELAEIYQSAKLFLFPSRGDPWGLVANEALQCGTPVICSPHAVSSHELVVPFDGGEMHPLEIGTWRDAVVRLLTDEAAWTVKHRARERARERFDISFSVGCLGRAIGVLEARIKHPEGMRAA